MQRYLLTVDASTVEGTIRALDEYLAIGNVDRPACKIVRDDATASQTTKLESTIALQTEVLSAQSAMLTVQAEAMNKLLSRLETLEHELKEPYKVKTYSGVVR